MTTEIVRFTENREKAILLYCRELEKSAGDVHSWGVFSVH